MKGRISISGLLVIASFLLLMSGAASLEVQILPREVTSQPLDFTITVKVQPDINSLYSFNLLVNDQDITFALI